MVKIAGGTFGNVEVEPFKSAFIRMRYHESTRGVRIAVGIIVLDQGAKRQQQKRVKLRHLHQDRDAHGRIAY
jgi:hypothetical protein